MYKIYNLQNQFIEETDYFPLKFTGIAEWTGSKAWYVDGKLHRLDGPAVEWHTGTKEWWIDDKRIHCSSNEHFKLLIDVMKLKGINII